MDQSRAEQEHWPHGPKTIRHHLKGFSGCIWNILCPWSCKRDNRRYFEVHVVVFGIIFEWPDADGAGAMRNRADCNEADAWEEAGVFAIACTAWSA